MAIIDKSDALFVSRENVKHYRLLLERTPDEDNRKSIHRLLAEEHARCRLLGDHSETRPERSLLD